MSELQQALFDDLSLPQVARQSAPASGRGIVAAPADPALITLAASLPAGLHLGTSSWSFPGWAGLVYGETYSETALARGGLRAYAQHPLLGAVGIDRTFYAPIATADYARYAAQVPDTFRFLVKAPMAITSSWLRDERGKFIDSPHFLDAGWTIDEFVAPCMAGLAGHAGPLVFQFPPQGRDATRNPDPFINRLYRFLKALPPLTGGAFFALEVRDAELLTDRFFKCLQSTGVRYCVASHARMPAPAKQIELAARFQDEGAFVARWSLHAGFQYADAKSRYFPFNRLIDEDVDSRASLARACQAALQRGFDAYVIVNNKAEGSAPLSIARLAQQIATAA